jgi:hypothetical protein
MNIDGKHIRAASKAIENSSVSTLMDRWGLIVYKEGRIEFSFRGLDSEPEIIRLKQFFDTVFAGRRQENTSGEWRQEPTLSNRFGQSPTETQSRYSYTIPHVLKDVMEFERVCKEESKGKGWIR